MDKGVGIYQVFERTETRNASSILAKLVVQQASFSGKGQNMKTFISIGALVASSLLVAADARAGIFDRFGRCQSAPQPAYPPAASAAVEGTTSYSSTYQPAEDGRFMQPSRPATRSRTFEDERRKIKGL